MKVSDLKKVKWTLLVERFEALLLASFEAQVTKKNTKKLSGLNWQATSTLYAGNGLMFYDGQELEALIKILSKYRAKDFAAFAVDLNQYVGRLEVLANDLSKKDFTSYADRQLQLMLNNFADVFQKACFFLAPMPIADKVLTKLIYDQLPVGDEKTKQTWLQILTYPTKENWQSIEEKEFLKLVLLYKKSSANRQQQLLSNHVAKFSWIGARSWWWARAWTIADLRQRVLAFNDDPNKHLRHLNSLRQQHSVHRQKLLQQLKLSPALKALITQAQDYAYLRTWRTDVIYGAGYKASKLFYEIAKRAGGKKSDVIYLTINEIKKMAQTKLWPMTASEMKKRKTFYANIAIKGNYQVVSGQVWRRAIVDISKKFLTIKNHLENGVVAYPGIVRGRARILRTGADIKKVKKGDIIVAIMTFPHFVPAMEKASGFITDEGGILCHAAIVAREMKKPCIIGTKNATKVLKDGQHIELNANLNTIKVLS